MTQPAAPRDDDQKLLPVVNVVWAAGDAAEPEAAGRAFEALAQAASLATLRWSAFYRAPALIRLLYARGGPPGPAILAAAERAGLVVRPREAGERSAGLDGEIAIVAAREFSAIAPAMPALVAPAGGGALRLAVVDANRPSYEGAALGRGDVAATPASLAEALLAPPHGVVERRKFLEYLGEDVHASALRVEYEVLLRLIGERGPASDGSDDAWERAAAVNDAASVDRGATLKLLRAEYERADALALAYGRRWRSTLAARSFLLFAANLLSGLIGALFPKLSVVTVPVQFVVTALLYLDQHVSGRRRWRGKWVDYRRAAEATRIARFCILAGVPALSSAPPSWIEWRLERLLRRAEPVSPLSDEDAARFLAYLNEVEIDRQIAYHRGAFRRFRRLNARLRQAAVFTLLATIGLCGAAVAVASIAASSIQIPSLGAIGLTLSAGPGLYAALNGLRSQLDVERQAARSARIGLSLRRLRRSLDGAPPSAALARAVASRAAEIMRDDVSSWDRVMEILGIA